MPRNNLSLDIQPSRAARRERASDTTPTKVDALRDALRESKADAAATKLRTDALEAERARAERQRLHALVMESRKAKARFLKENASFHRLIGSPSDEQQQAALSTPMAPHDEYWPSSPKNSRAVASYAPTSTASSLTTISTLGEVACTDISLATARRVLHAVEDARVMSIDVRCSA